MRHHTVTDATLAVNSPVGDQTRVDVAVLALVALLRDGHLADGPPQSGQEQAGDEQVGHHDGRALRRGRNGDVFRTHYRGCDVTRAARGRKSTNLSTDGTGELKDVQSNVQERLHKSWKKMLRKSREKKAQCMTTMTSEEQRAPC